MWATSENCVKNLKGFLGKKKWSNQILFNFDGPVRNLWVGIIIIIIIKKGWQCKALRERLISYQSEDPNPTTPTHGMKEEKGKIAGDKK